MKRSRRSVAWDHFELKNDLVHCQHCEAIPEAGGDEETALSDTDEESANTEAAASQSQVSNMTQLLGEHYNTQRDSGIEAELHNFLREAPPALDCSPTDWWKVNGIRLPQASQVSTELPVYHGDVSPLRAGFSGGWTDDHQAAFASDPRAC
ncbi:unnamed protein product [Pleuronectes platessa]|uniref:Uncharacterized protein n=1 Tax=Pleuronectes platessa TaxID=8262 RepID=A0A9N7V214_PLEPL|nr:unnamed protein product [Pleuronectes platessa]